TVCETVEATKAVYAGLSVHGTVRRPDGDGAIADFGICILRADACAAADRHVYRVQHHSGLGPQYRSHRKYAVDPGVLYHGRAAGDNHHGCGAGADHHLRADHTDSGNSDACRGGWVSFSPTLRLNT